MCAEAMNGFHASVRAQTGKTKTLLQNPKQFFRTKSNVERVLTKVNTVAVDGTHIINSTESRYHLTTPPEYADAEEIQL
jgi:hypothetical protein